MNQSLNEFSNSLVMALDELVRLYRGLLETVRREKDILINSHLDELNENNRAKEALLIKIQEAEKTRQSAADILADHVGYLHKPIRLLELANHCPNDSADRLRNFHSVLEIILKRVQELNIENELLVQSALHHITGAMKSIRENLQDKPTYQRKGEVSANPASTGHLVSREA